MKYLILIVLIFLSTTLHSQWIIQNSGTTEALHDVEFINQFTGWACGDGVILKTTNSGKDWTQQIHPATDKFLYSIHPVDENILYCVGWFETILKSTNGGANWTAIRNGPFGQGSSYFACFFINDNTGWVGGSGSKTWKTTNGGQTFDSIFISVAYIRDFYFRNSLEGLLCGEGGHVRKTSDGGLNWLGVNIPLGGALSNFQKISIVNDYCWVAGNDNRVFRSTDFGSNWILLDTIQQIIGQAQLYCIRFSDENTGWTGGSYGNLWKTTDSGFTWIREETHGDQRYFGSMWFYNDSIGWGVGGAGKIFHTTTGGQTVVNISNNTSELPYKFLLHQNYPNPFNPTTTIRFSIPYERHVTLKIFDILGKEKTTLVNKKMNIGNYEVTFNGSNLMSGVYFYTLEAGDFRETKKMLLIK